MQVIGYGDRLFGLANMKKKKFAVIGLNTFGIAVMRVLSELGYERLGIDIDRAKVQQVAAELVDVIEGDATQQETLQEAGIDQCDVAVVALGTNLAASILVTLSLKQLGIPFIVAKAKSEIHAEALKRVGANLIVFPERDSAIHLAKALLFSGFLDANALTNGFSLAKVRPLPSFIGKSIRDVALRSKLNLNIVLIEQKNGKKIQPEPSYIFKPEDTLYIVGDDACLARYAAELEKETKS